VPRGTLCGIEAEIADDNAAVRLKIALGDRVTDAAIGARDEGDLAVQFHERAISF